MLNGTGFFVAVVVFADVGVAVAVAVLGSAVAEVEVPLLALVVVDDVFSATKVSTPRPLSVYSTIAKLVLQIFNLNLQFLLPSPDCCKLCFY